MNNTRFFYLWIVFWNLLRYIFNNRRCKTQSHPCSPPFSYCPLFITLSIFFPYRLENIFPSACLHSSGGHANVILMTGGGFSSFWVTGHFLSSWGLIAYHVLSGASKPLSTTVASKFSYCFTALTCCFCTFAPPQPHHVTICASSRHGSFL